MQLEEEVVLAKVPTGQVRQATSPLPGAYSPVLQVAQATELGFAAMEPGEQVKQKELEGLG